MSNSLQMLDPIKALGYPRSRGDLSPDCGLLKTYSAKRSGESPPFAWLSLIGVLTPRKWQELIIKKSLKSRTKIVHAGNRRSQFNEVSEAFYLTQSHVYDSAEQAQEVLDGDDEGHFIYARYGNSTVAMFQERVAAFKGAMRLLPPPLVWLRSAAHCWPR